MVSPLHRDPDSEEDDYGCFTKRADKAVGAVVRRTIRMLQAGELNNADEVLDVVRPALQRIGHGSCDTVVKENVFYALDAALSAAGIEFDQMLIYGW